MQAYVADAFSPAEREILARHFTSLDGPVAVLVNLPEATKAALFARYSRTVKPLKRVFLDEFYRPADDASVLAGGDETGLARASDLFSRVLSDYGDDSVAQLAGVHVSCEQVSNLLTKVLERGRLMGYLEQSTRYVPYGDRPGGFHRYYRDPEVLASEHAADFTAAMDGLFAAYNTVSEAVRQYMEASLEPADAAGRRAVRAAAFDVARGLLPAGTVSNVGIYGSAQAYEQLVLRLRSDPLPEARRYAEILLAELQKVIPDFLTRLGRPERGGVWVDYRRDRLEGLAALAAGLPGTTPTTASMAALPTGAGATTRLTRWTERGEDEIIAAALFAHSQSSMPELRAHVAGLSEQQRRDILRASVGHRRNRRHHPGREWEACEYEFEVVSDYGAFRDLQRHRLLTIEWQRLSPALGYDIPTEVEAAGAARAWRDAVERAEAVYAALAPERPAQAAYLVTLAHRVRYVMRMNAREAMHVVELRSSPQGHPTYRRVAQEMHALIRDVAGHTLVAEAMSFVNREDVHLGRLDAEQRADARLAAAVAPSDPGGAPG